jgi:integrase
MCPERSVIPTVTFKPRYQETSLGVLENHLIPFFGDRDLRSIREADLLDYIRVKLDSGQKPPTILNALSIVRRVLNLAVREGLIQQNPARGIGNLIARVARREDSEVAVIASWTREEAERLLRLAEEHEPSFSPLLRFLLSTGGRRSEALGLQWQDIDFQRSRITIRRALTKGVSVTPKSGKGRVVAMPPGLASSLLDLLATRRQQALARGWPEVPSWVFCSEAGTPLDERNVTRSWYRVRRRGQKQGVRPLKLHCARHTYATLALEAGRSIRFVAEQLGHSNPELTLRVYAHALPVEEHDLGFADFASGFDFRRPDDGSKRLYPAPGIDVGSIDDKAPRPSNREAYENLERETGLEPATLSLGTGNRAKK